MTTEGDFSVGNSSSDDEAIAPKTKRSPRGVLLQYMLYDAFIRPTAWHFAPLHDADRERAWREAVTRVCRENQGAVYVLSNASELPSVPVYAASAIRDAQLPARFVHVLEPRRPIASALRAVIKDNALDESTRVLQSSPGVYRPNRKAADDAPGAPARLLLVPGAEDIATVGKALDDVAEAQRVVQAVLAEIRAGTGGREREESS